MTYPGRSLCLSGRARLPYWQQGGRGTEKSAEAIVVSGELMKGRILYGKEQAEILDGCGATARRVDPVESL